MTDSLQLIAHRGGLYYRPENSIAAFEHSVELGIEWVECDVRLTRDNVLVLHHDDGRSGHGNGRKAIHDLDYEQLKSMDIGGGQHIPTVSDMLEKFKDKLHFDLELKEIDTVEKILPLLEQLGAIERVVISSFIPEALQLVKELMPQIRTGLLIDRLTGNITGGRSAVNGALLLGCSFIAPDYRIIKPDWIETAKSEGLRTVAWTVNHMQDGIRLVDMGIDGLISDRPDRFIPLVAT